MTLQRCWLAVGLLTLAMGRAGVAGRILYVDASAAGINDGISWDNAYRYLQDALGVACVAEKPIEIRVAQGVYTPDRGGTAVIGDHRASFRLVNGVTLKGGFAGCTEPDPDVRDVDRFQSILSGDLAGNDSKINRPTDLRTDGTRADNSLRVVVGNRTDGSAVLDGFTIAGGHWFFVSGTPGTGAGGSGLYNDGGSPAVIDCTFTRNVCVMNGSGAMLNKGGGRPSLIRCAFIGNYSMSQAAGMVNYESDPHIADCTFADNAGGAMLNGRGNPVVENCTFAGNSGGTGAAILNRGGHPKLLNCTFTGNTAAYGGAIANEQAGELSLTRCTFHGNSAQSGGAVVSEERGLCLLTNCTFRANDSLTEGGAILLGYDDLRSTAVNCLFVGNRVLGPMDRAAGGAIAMLGGTSVFRNCTFADNWAEHSRTIHFLGKAAAQLYGCIVRDPNAVEQNPYGGEAVVQHSDVSGGFPGEGNIDVDPCFAAKGLWMNGDGSTVPGDPKDPNSTWVDGDYHLKSQAGRWDPKSQSWVKDDVTSPCIDAGDPNSPVGEEPFPNGGRVNMGAYGGTAEASKSYFGEPVCETIIAGDINGDCIVDLKDLALLTEHWLAGPD